MWAGGTGTETNRWGRGSAVRRGGPCVLWWLSRSLCAGEAAGCFHVESGDVDRWAWHTGATPLGLRKQKRLRDSVNKSSNKGKERFIWAVMYHLDGGVHMRRDASLP